ncbi:MAG TPA: Rieske (2Fe-2S) protein, partial [Pseudomonas sp.]|nr:Rieske (2Fe-2S) protein [Pseudomonas sp.]
GKQANLLASPQRNLLKLNIDAGAVQARRILERWVAQEQTGAAAALIATAQ